MPGYWGKPEATAETITDGRLAAHRRHRPPRRGRLPLHHRPGQGHDHPGRRERVLRRDREPPRRAPGHRRRRGHRRAPPELGEEVKAVVQVEPGHTITEAEVKAWVAETLANFKVPAYVESPTSACPATPAASCSRTSSAARARSASPRPCDRPDSAVPWPRWPGWPTGTRQRRGRVVRRHPLHRLRDVPRAGAGPVRRDRHPVGRAEPAARPRGRAPGLAGRRRLPHRVHRPLAPHPPARRPVPAGRRRPGGGPRAHVRGLVRRHQLPGRTARREPHGRLPRLHPPAHRRDRRPGRPRPRAAHPSGRRRRRAAVGRALRRPGVDPPRRPPGRAVRHRRGRGHRRRGRRRRASP